MRVLVTGAKGTLGPRLTAELEAHGHACAAWDRGAVSPDDPAAVEAHLSAVDPDAVAHLALGAEAWAEGLARWCAARGRPLVYTSTAMVFGPDPGGPHRPDDPRSGTDDYGRYKARCEDRVRAAHPDATVARIGWQIGLARTGGNDMLEHLCAQQEREGRLTPSRRWVPACSFLVDTAAALRGLLEAPVAGVVHLDGNATTAWDFAALVAALRAGPGEAGWVIEPNDEFVYDQRLLNAPDDDVQRVASIAARLGDRAGA